MFPGRTGARAAAYSSSQMTRSISPASRPPYSLGHVMPTQPPRVHRLLPDAAALEGLAIGRDAVVGGVVQTQLRREIRGEPVAEFLAKALVLGGELEIHDGCESRLVVESGRCQGAMNFAAPRARPKNSRSRGCARVARAM
jgi:hypothetical protein